MAGAGVQKNDGERIRHRICSSATRKSRKFKIPIRFDSNREKEEETLKKVDQLCKDCDDPSYLLKILD